jgi:hypothetical protein
MNPMKRLVTLRTLLITHMAVLAICVGGFFLFERARQENLRELFDGVMLSTKSVEASFLERMQDHLNKGEVESAQVKINNRITHLRKETETAHHNQFFTEAE